MTTAPELASIARPTLSARRMRDMIRWTGNAVARLQAMPVDARWDHNLSEVLVDMNCMRGMLLEVAVVAVDVEGDALATEDAAAREEERAIERAGVA